MIKLYLWVRLTFLLTVLKGLLESDQCRGFGCCELSQIEAVGRKKKLGAAPVKEVKALSYGLPIISRRNYLEIKEMEKLIRI